MLTLQDGLSQYGNKWRRSREFISSRLTELWTYSLKVKQEAFLNIYFKLLILETSGVWDFKQDVFEAENSVPAAGLMTSCPSWLPFDAVCFVPTRRSCPARSPAWSTASKMLMDVRVILFDWWTYLFSAGRWLMWRCVCVQSFCSWRASCRPSRESGPASTDCAWTSSSRWPQVRPSEHQQHRSHL